MISVFYDGQCGFCSREIRYYQKIAPAGIFDWQDISQDDSVLKTHQIEWQTALQELHVVDDIGNRHIGFDAFLVIWRPLPFFRYLALLCKLPLIKPLLRWIYRRFATWRFRRAAHCKVDKKD